MCSGCRRYDYPIDIEVDIGEFDRSLSDREGTMEEKTEVLDAKEAAKYLKINEQTVRRLAREGAIPAFKVGGVWRFKQSVLDSWAVAQGQPRGEGRVLVVDDDEPMLELLRRILEKQGFNVTTVSSGKRALEMIRENPPDMVLLDLKIPDMDGASVLEKIRCKWTGLPVVILTGYPESDLVGEALKYSPITLLAKGAEDEQIIAAVRGAVKQRS